MCKTSVRCAVRRFGRTLRARASQSQFLFLSDTMRMTIGVVACVSVCVHADAGLHNDASPAPERRGYQEERDLRVLRVFLRLCRLLGVRMSALPARAPSPLANAPI